MTRLVLASSNRGKLAEVRARLADVGLDIVSLAETGFAGELEETGATFAANATLKAETVARALGLPVLADDSGLEVEALGGAPGIYSARYGGEPSSDPRNRAKLLAALRAVPPPRRARFRCVLALACPGAPTVLEEGSLDGEIALAACGTSGFGYDPIFLVPTLGRTLAELPLVEKNRLSHRGRALEKMLPHLRALARKRE